MSLIGPALILVPFDCSRFLTGLKQHETLKGRGKKKKKRKKRKEKETSGALVITSQNDKGKFTSYILYYTHCYFTSHN